MKLNNHQKKCPKCEFELTIIWKEIERWLKCYKCGNEEKYPISQQEAEDWK